VLSTRDGDREEAPPAWERAALAAFTCFTLGEIRSIQGTAALGKKFPDCRDRLVSLQVLTNTPTLVQR